MNITIKDSEIEGGVLNQAVVGDNNKVIYGNGNISENNDISKFIDYMDRVIVVSNNVYERKCALRAKNLCNQNKSDLKDYLIDNICTFTAGTFANIAGGLLLELIKKIIR